MRSQVDDARTTALIVLAKRTAIGVGLIAIGAVIDVVPEKLAELSLGMGICLMLTAAVAPLSLLNRMAGTNSTRAAQPNDA